MDIAIIAERVKKRCRENNVSIKEVLEKAYASKSFIYDVGTRGRRPSAEVMNNLAAVLNCSVDYLLGVSDIKKPSEKNPEGKESYSEKVNRLISLAKKLDDTHLDALLVLAGESNPPQDK